MSGQICRLCLKCTNGFAIRPLHHPRAHTMDEFFISSFTPIYVFSAMRLCYHALSHRVIESESQSRVRKMALIKLQHHSKKWINHKTQRTKRRRKPFKKAHRDDDDDEVQTQSRRKWCKIQPRTARRKRRRNALLKDLRKSWRWDKISPQ